MSKAMGSLDIGLEEKCNVSSTDYSMECALEEYPVVNKSGVSSPYIKVSSIYSGTEVCLLS
jgi:hypothetical protein